MPDQMSEEFARRRRQLMRLMGRDAIAVLPAAPERTRNNDVYYNYRQDSDFHYLTGFAEPDSVAVLIPGRPQGEFVMFVRERNASARSGTAGAPDRRVHAAHYGADDAFPDRRSGRHPARPAREPARACTTPWASTTISTSAWSAG